MILDKVTYLSIFGWAIILTWLAILTWLDNLTWLVITIAIAVIIIIIINNRVKLEVLIRNNF